MAALQIRDAARREGAVFPTRPHVQTAASATNGALAPNGYFAALRIGSLTTFVAAHAWLGDLALFLAAALEAGRRQDRSAIA